MSGFEDKILIAVQQEDLRKLLENQCREAGFRTDSAENLHRLLAFFKNLNRYQLVIADKEPDELSDFIRNHLSNPDRLLLSDETGISAKKLPKSF